MCCVSSLHLEWRNHVLPLPITTFLTCEGGLVAFRLLLFRLLPFCLATYYHSVPFCLYIHSSLCPCLSPGSVCLLMLCYGQDEMACHLHPIFCTWDVASYHQWTPVTIIFFPLGVWLCSKKIITVQPSLEEQSMPCR